MELIDAINEIEGRHFRTASDTGAHSNALIVQNTYRDLAGLPRLSRSDLREKEIDGYKRSLADAFLAGNVEGAMKYKGYIESVLASTEGKF